MSEQVIRSKTKDGIAIITLYRPDVHNALNRQLIKELSAEFQRVAKNSETRAVILTGSGEKAFCAGADLKERRGMSEEEVKAFIPGIRNLMNECAALPMPSICAINGVALGGGLELALACDIRIAVENAMLGLPEVTLAIIPGAGGTQRLPRVVGLAKAKELIFTGKRITAKEALNIGLVNEITASENLMQAALNMAGLIRENGPIAVRQAKKAMEEGLDLPLARGISFETECYDVTIPTQDRREALLAFQEKRKPKYTGK